VTLRDSLTTAERTLAQSGQDLEVLAMRRAFQNTMRDDMIATVEQLTNRRVERHSSATTSMTPSPSKSPHAPLRRRWPQGGS